MKRNKLFIIFILITLSAFLYIFLYSNMDISDKSVIHDINKENNKQDKEPKKENVSLNPIIEDNDNKNNTINLEVTDNDGSRPDYWRAEDYLWQEIPELKDFGNYIINKSEGKAFLIVEGAMEPIEVYKNEDRDELLGNYYLIYVGEEWEDHRANWYWFYVSEDINDILWCEIVEDEVYSLEEWRNSSGYKNQMAKVYEAQQLE